MRAARDHARPAHANNLAQEGTLVPTGTLGKGDRLGSRKPAPSGCEGAIMNHVQSLTGRMPRAGQGTTPASNGLRTAAAAGHLSRYVLLDGHFKRGGLS